jgi:hypothetical protein
MLAWAALPVVSPAQSDQRPLSPPRVVEAPDSLDQWETDDWNDDVTYAVEPSTRSDRAVLRI